MPPLASTVRDHVRRWWTYQRERFPLHAHAPLVAAFSLAAVSYAAALREAAPSAAACAGAFVVGLAFFWLLRVADEFKDAGEDRRHRPHRPVPRGLVSLRELGASGVLAAGVQLVCVEALTPAVLPLLLLAWGYFALMCVEFFAPRWLGARPGRYLLSHAGITPLIALVLSGFGGRAAGTPWPAGLGWFLAASFFGGLVIEIGRKLRAPADEAPGVQTYTKAWGRRRAVGAWVAVLAGALVCATLAAAQIGAALPVALGLAALLLGATGAAVSFLQRPVPRRARFFEPLSGAFVLGMYGALVLAVFLF